MRCQRPMALGGPGPFLPCRPSLEVLPSSRSSGLVAADRPASCPPGRPREPLQSADGPPLRQRALSSQHREKKRVGGPVALRHLRSPPLPFLELQQSWRSGRAGSGTMARGLLWSFRLGNRTEPLCRRPQAWGGAQQGCVSLLSPQVNRLWTGTHSPGEGPELSARGHLRCSPAAGNVRVRVSGWVPAFRLLGAHPRVESPWVPKDRGPSGTGTPPAWVFPGKSS